MKDGAPEKVGKRQPGGRTGEERRERGENLPEFPAALAVGERDHGFTERPATRRREEGRRRLDSRAVCISPSTLQASLCFSPRGSAASELLGTPGGGLLQGHARAECRELLGAAHIRSLKHKRVSIFLIVLICAVLI